MPQASSEDMALKDTSPADSLSPWRTGPLVSLVLGAGAVGAVLAGTIALWLHYGSAVFFEMVRSGFMACFG